MLFEALAASRAFVKKSRPLASQPYKGLCAALPRLLPSPFSIIHQKALLPIPLCLHATLYDFPNTLLFPA